MRTRDAIQSETWAVIKSLAEEGVGIANADLPSRDSLIISAEEQSIYCSRKLRTGAGLVRSDSTHGLLVRAPSDTLSTALFNTGAWSAEDRTSKGLEKPWTDVDSTVLSAAKKAILSLHNAPPFEAGVGKRSRMSIADERVGLLDDPGRRGSLTGKERARDDGLILQVRWDDGSLGWVPEYELEQVNDGPEDVYDLIERGRYGRISDLRRNLTFIHLGGKLANVVYSMDATNTEFYPYQFKPVLSFLESPSGGLLIADEVGLGKTIEAGLIWTELRARLNARRLLVVCPAMLRDKWCAELDSKFGVDAIQVDARELAKELKKDKRRVPEGKAFVASIQGLRPPPKWQYESQTSPQAGLAKVLDQLSDEEPSIDLLIIDEAHYLRNPETRSSKLGHMLRAISEHVVLLSATPVNNKEQDLFELLRLVDEESFGHYQAFPQVLSANEPLIAARNHALNPKIGAEAILAELKRAQAHPLLKDNRQLENLVNKNLEQDYLSSDAGRVALADLLEKANLLRHTVNRTRKVEVHELRVVRTPESYFAPIADNGPERAFYDRVTEAIREYALKNDINDGFLLAPPQRMVSSCMYAAAQSWNSQRPVEDRQELLYEDLGADDICLQDDRPLIAHIAKTVLPGFDIEALKSQDSKYSRLREELLKHYDEHPTEKIVLFSFFKGTLRYLAERLEADGLCCLLLHGGVKEQKSGLLKRFESDPKIQVLLTSEVASEGVDLQFSRVLINYDLPWNPMKIEQRIGRLDRIGQKSDRIAIWNLGYAGTIDERIYRRLLIRLKIFERALGGMEAILGQRVTELAGDLLSRPLTDQEEKRRIDETYLAIANVRRQQEDLENEASHLIAHGGYILEKVRAAHDFKRRIDAQDIKLYVYEFLKSGPQGFEFQESASDEMEATIRLANETIVRFIEFAQNLNLQGRSRLGTGARLLCRFENRVDHRSGKVERINQFHPLVQFITSELKAAGAGFYPLVAIRLYTDLVPSGRYLMAGKRWNFSGLRTEEEMQFAAVSLDDGGSVIRDDEAWKVANLARLEGDDWLGAANEVVSEQVATAVDACNMELERAYKRKRDEKNCENADRISFQINQAKRHRDRQLETRRRVLHDLRASGKTKLIPATEGRIRKIQERFDIQLETLTHRQTLTSHADDVVYALMEIHRTAS